jgi:hypothetical protein
LSQLTSQQRIRRRQIIEHLWIQRKGKNIREYNFFKSSEQAFLESLMYAWNQRTFIDIWKQTHENFFVKEESIKVIKKKIAEQYIFELYQVKEFIDSGLTSLRDLLTSTRTELLLFFQFSDDALANLFKKSK